MLGGYGCGVIVRALLCCRCLLSVPLRLSDGAPVLRAWLRLLWLSRLGCLCLLFSLAGMRKGSARFILCRAFCVCPSMNFRRVWFPLLANPYPLPPLVQVVGGSSVLSLSGASVLAWLSAVWYSGGMVSGSDCVRIVSPFISATVAPLNTWAGVTLCAAKMAAIFSASDRLKLAAIFL